MKTIVSLSFIFISYLAFSQVKGDISEDHRKLLTETSFVKEGKKNGRLVYDIAVDAKGNVTGIKRNDDESDFLGGPIHIQIRNYVKSFKFEKGTHFPKHHQGSVIITVVKPK